MNINNIKLVRVYDHDQPEGFRILVDRLWPRGLSKVKAALDLWEKGIAPSNELRKWFNHEDDKYPEFCKKYFKELDANIEMESFINLMNEKSEIENVLFLYSAKNLKYNQAVALRDYLKNKS